MLGRTYFWDDRVLYLGPDLPSGLHAHHALQVCVSLSAAFRVRSSARGRWTTCRAVVIPSDVPHETRPVIPLLASLWLDGDGPTARQLAGGETHAIRPLASAERRAIVPCLRGCWEGNYDSRRAPAVVDEVIGALAPAAVLAERPLADPRVRRAHELLRAAPMRRMAIAELADAVSLSPSRLTHLLRPHLGLPIRRYLLWLRLRDALGALAGGAAITDAAHAAGFADAAHLDRTFRRMLGFTPSAVVRGSRFVQDRARRGV